MTELEPDGAPIEVGGLRLAATGGPVSVALPERSAPSGSIGAAFAAAGLDEVAGATVEAQPTAVSRAPRRGGGPVQPDAAASVTLTAPPPPPGRGQVLLVEDAGAFRWVLPDAVTPGAPRRRGAAAGTTFTINVATTGSDDDGDRRRGRREASSAGWRRRRCTFSPSTSSTRWQARSVTSS